MTGAVVPADCDLIIPVEQITKANSTFEIPKTNLTPYQFIHKKGSDFQKGDLLVPAYQRIKSREIAIAASIGQTPIEIISPPTVTIITTGDEVIPIAQTPSHTQIRQSNGIALQAALQPYSLSNLNLIHVKDDAAHTQETVKKAIKSSNLVLLTGGISKGKFDFVRKAVDSQLGSPLFHGVAQKPGKPLAFWHQESNSDPKTVFALPGNPISVAITFHKYVTQFLDQWFRQDAPQMQITLAQDFEIKKPLPLESFVPATLTSTRHGLATLSSIKNSGDLASSIQTTGFVKLPSNKKHFPQGSVVSYHPWI